MKHTTILFLLSFTILNVKAQSQHNKIYRIAPYKGNAPAPVKRVQDFILNERTRHWEAKGEPYYRPDTLTLIRGYKWKRERIIAIQDYKKENDKWVRYGKPYATPDTLKLIHAFVK